MSFKSTTCKSRKGDFLTSYDSPEEAKQGAAFIKKQHGHDLTSYKCETCNYYHLAPRDRQTPMSYECGCKDSKGKPKALYSTLKDAKTRTAILRKELGADVRPYECPLGKGWHLTHTPKR